MSVERHRAHRYAFSAPVELTDVASGLQLNERTDDLSLFGCHVRTSRPLPVGTKIRLRITHGGSSFAALGTVAYSQANSGLGVVFTNIEPNQQLILDKWIAALRRQ